MTDSSSKKAIAFADAKEGHFPFILAKVKKLQALTQQLAAYIDPHFTPYYQVANITNGKLILITENAAIATQLRYQSSDLLAQCKRNPELSHIQQIECKVRPKTTTAPAPHQKPVDTLSQDTAQIIKEMAKSLPDDRLRAVMESIAKRTK